MDTITVSRTSEGKFILSKMEEVHKAAQLPQTSSCQSWQAAAMQLQQWGANDSSIQDIERQLETNDTAVTMILGSALSWTTHGNVFASSSRGMSLASLRYFRPKPNAPFRRPNISLHRLACSFDTPAVRHRCWRFVCFRSLLRHSWDSGGGLIRACSILLLDDGPLGKNPDRA